MTQQIVKFVSSWKRGLRRWNNLKRSVKDQYMERVKFYLNRVMAQCKTCIFLCVGKECRSIVQKYDTLWCGTITVVQKKESDDFVESIMIFRLIFLLTSNELI